MADHPLVKTQVKVSKSFRLGAKLIIQDFLLELGIETQYRKGRSFWLTNEARLHWIYEEFCENVRQKLKELHPDTGGDHESFINFYARVKIVKKAFAYKGYHNDLLTRTLHEAVNQQEKLETRRATRSRSSEHTDYEEPPDLSLWALGVFDRIVVPGSRDALVKIRYTSLIPKETVQRAIELFERGVAFWRVYDQTGIPTARLAVIRNSAKLPLCRCGKAISHRNGCIARRRSSLSIMSITDSSIPEAKVSMRTILLTAIRGGETDEVQLVGLVQRHFPEISLKRIHSSITTHRSFVRRENATAQQPTAL